MVYERPMDDAQKKEKKPIEGELVGFIRGPRKYFLKSRERQ
jgi:hypothetical protein